MKQLLHVGVNAGTESLPRYFREQCQYSEIKLDQNTASNLTAWIMNNPTPDIVFLQIQSDTIAGMDTNSLIGSQIKMLKDRGAFVWNWTGDLRNTTPEWMIRFAPNVSITAFSNYRDIQYCKSKGIPTGFLQQGIDTAIFTPDGGVGEDNNIVFLANNYGNQFPLSDYRRRVINRLQNDFGHGFKVYGNGWQGGGNVNHSQYEEAKIYRGAKIAISVSHYDVDGYFSDRLGRALCTGPMVLSHNYQGIDRDFKVGEHLDVFNDLNELSEKCRYYLQHEEQREGIAMEGFKHASKRFNYQEMVKQIINYESIYHRV